MQSLIRRHPLTAFLTWFFTVGQALAFTPMVASRTSGVELSGHAFLVAATLVGLLLPAAVVTRLSDGPAGLATLWRRSLNFAVPPRWYALALLGIPALTVAGTVAFLGLPTVTGPAQVASALVSGLGVHLVVAFVAVNWWEEVAWTGFVQTRLQARHGPMRAAALTGVVFALGHVSIAVGGSWSETVTLMGLLVVVSIPFRALAGWVCNSTDSVAMVGLVHAAANATALGSLAGAGFLPRLYPGEEPGGLVFPLLAVLGLVVILLTRARLGRAGTTTEAPEPQHLQLTHRSTTTGRLP